jgi:hypothetical protein
MIQAYIVNKSIYVNTCLTRNLFEYRKILHLWSGNLKLQAQTVPLHRQPTKPGGAL